MALAGLSGGAVVNYPLPHIVHDIVRHTLCVMYPPLRGSENNSVLVIPILSHITANRTNE